jgi:hypothetical protein
VVRIHSPRPTFSITSNDPPVKRFLPVDEIVDGIRLSNLPHLGTRAWSAKEQLADDAANYPNGISAACANNGGESPECPRSRLPALSAASSGGPAGNSIRSSPPPLGSNAFANLPDALRVENVPIFDSRCEEFQWAGPPSMRRLGGR